MATSFVSGTQPNTNLPLEIDPGAIQIICSYPLASQRKDYTPYEWIRYKYEWDTFNKVFGYNYTVSTLNGQASAIKYGAYAFSSDNENIAYRNGQRNHVFYYSDYLGITPATTFADIYPYSI